MYSNHCSFFLSLCIASKVDTAISLAKKALDDGHCCVIGLQSTGEARSKGAAQAAGFDESGKFEDFISAPNEDLKRVIMMMFPLPPKPKGVIAPVFLNPIKNAEETALSNDDSKSNDDTPNEGSQEKRRFARNENPKPKKRRLLNGTSIRNNDIPWHDISLDLDASENVENERKVNYRKAAEKIKLYLDSVDDLELPANPLDRLLNELGGPDKVAELTGRKIRQIRRHDESGGMVGE